MPIISDINNVLFDYNEGRDIEDKKKGNGNGKKFISMDRYIFALQYDFKQEGRNRYR
jgi:hypothetical protein